jgi:hypothetical protein
MLLCAQVFDQPPAMLSVACALSCVHVIHSSVKMVSVICRRARSEYHVANHSEILTYGLIPDIVMSTSSFSPR